MGFINDMLSWEQSSRQRKIQKATQAQQDQAAYLVYYANYQAQSAHRQELLMLDILGELQKLNDRLSRPVSTVSV